MEKDKKIRNEEIFAKRIEEVEIHTMAEINPMQSKDDFVALKYSIEQIGQQEPVVMFKGKLVDGRNRLKAIKELYNEVAEEEKFKYRMVKYKKLPTTLSISELEEIIIGKETRRHKTSTQKAVQAMNYYIKKTEEGIDINMTKVGKIFGASQAQLSRAITCRKAAGELVIQRLFNGEKITISKSKKDGTIYKTQTDSLDAITKYYNAINKSNALGRSSEQTISSIELSYSQILATEIIDDMSYDGINYLINILESNKDTLKVNYNVTKMKTVTGLETVSTINKDSQ
jgi:hypothetical protein